MPTAQTPHIGPDGTPTFLLRRLAAVDWAQSAELVVVPTPPWETDDSWRQLYHDSRQLLLYLTSLCDLDTGWVDFQPESMLGKPGRQLPDEASALAHAANEVAAITGSPEART